MKSVLEVVLGLDNETTFLAGIRQARYFEQDYRTVFVPYISPFFEHI